MTDYPEDIFTEPEPDSDNRTATSCSFDDVRFEASPQLTEWLCLKLLRRRGGVGR